MCVCVFWKFKKPVDKASLKVAFFQKVKLIFQISKSPKKNIPKDYPEFEIQNFRPYQNTVMGGNFKFQVQDSFSEYFLLEIWKFEKRIALSEKKTLLLK